MVEHFDFIELAPDVFKAIRRINNIEEKLVRDLFSEENEKNLESYVSPAKRGSFVIKCK